MAHRKWLYREAVNGTCNPCLKDIGLSPTPFCGFPRYKPVPPDRFKIVCWFYDWNNQKLTKSGFMEKPGIEPGTPGLQGIGLIPYTFLWLSWVLTSSTVVISELCWFYNGNTQRLTESGFMEKPGIEPATPGLQGIARIHYTTAASISDFSLFYTFCLFSNKFIKKFKTCWFQFLSSCKTFVIGCKMNFLLKHPCRML